MGFIICKPMIGSHVFLFLIWVVINTFATANAELVTRDCNASWALLTTQRNHLRKEFSHEFSYRVGLHSSRSSGKAHWEKDPETLVAISIKLRSNNSRHSHEVQMAHSGLSSVAVKTGKVTVPRLSVMTAWQLIAKSQGSVLGFGYTAVTTGEVGPTTRIASCSATYNVRARISQNSWFRLKHEKTGQYLVVTMRKGWNAGTLGYSRQYRFRFSWLESSVVRIVAETYRFPGYMYLHSSVFGGIYFDDSDLSDDTQKWTLSIPNPRDGDSVTFRNVYYHSAYMTYYDGSTTNVFCENTTNPDRWIIELA